MGAILASPLLDPDRLAALRATELLDTPPEPAFDRLTRLAARLAGSPVAIISLVDEGRQYLKSTHGVEGLRETPLSHSFCRHVVEGGAPLVIEDAREHHLVKDNPAVGEYGVLAYAGVPLRTASGQDLGALCVVESEPRTWHPDVVDVLEDLAAAAMTEIELRERHRALQAREQRQAAVMSSSLDAIVTMDAGGRIVDFNPAAERTFRLPAEAAVGRDLAEAIIPAELRADHRRGLARHLASGDAACLGRRLQVTAVRADGERFDAELAVTRSDIAGRPFFTGYLRDLSEQRRTEAALQSTEQRLRTVVGSAPMALAAIDRRGVYRIFEGLSVEQLGLEPGAVVGRHYADVWAGAPEVARVVERALTGETFTEELDVGDRTFDVSCSPLLDGAGAVESVITVAVDITARRSSERELERLASHDRLTGLPNREQLEAQLERVLAARRADGGSAALLFLDLDQFKVVNDSLGHSAGDELLCQTGARLAGALRRGDLIARHGGDEFLVLLDDLGADAEAAAATVSGKLLAALEPEFVVGDAAFQVGASVGIALYPRDGEDGAELLRKADAAMYEAKRSGRNASALYSPALAVRPGRLTLTARLRRALARDEFVLHFQPLWDLRHRTIVGVESLIRWEDPEHGMVPPLEFIGHAEEHGLIDLIGDWVIEHACAQAAAWRREGLDLGVGFNVAPRQLQSPGFVDRLAATVARHGADPRRLTVEITESAAMGDPATTEAVLRALDELGPLVAIDDFGAGHSSLGRLRELPVKGLKLDRSFLARVPEDDAASAIVGGVLALTESLGLHAIAEGIETEEQLAFLVERGCRWGQGFHLARPLPAAEVTELLRRSSVAVPR